MRQDKALQEQAQRAQAAMPFYREAGQGPGVVCLHSNASSSSQWRALMERLAPRFHVLAPDAYGAGKSPSWTVPRRRSLSDEAALVEAMLDAAGPSYALVGHSYGAAVALVSALRQPQRVRALVLYEPTLFALIDADSPSPNAADEARAVVEQQGGELQPQHWAAAAQRFIDYWMGAGAWARMAPERQAPIAASMVNLLDWGHALMTEPTPLQAFARLECPVLYLLGQHTTRSARAVARLLGAALPRVELLELAHMGHMGPVTHAPEVNEAIERFLRRQLLNEVPG